MADVNRNLLAPCGLYCGVCGVYYATRDNNTKFMERLVDFYKSGNPKHKDLTVESIQCNGCLSDTLSSFCSKCEIRSCTREKGYEGCHECGDFPCGHIDDFSIPVGKRVIMRAIPYRREHGTEKWVDHEETRYHCPDCGNKVFRGAKRCNKCKTEVDVD
jgi:hypothetical protein